MRHNLQGSGHGIYERGYADHAQRDSLYDQSNDHPQHGSGKQMTFTIKTHATAVVQIDRIKTFYIFYTLSANGHRQNETKKKIAFLL